MLRDALLSDSYMSDHCCFFGPLMAATEIGLRDFYSSAAELDFYKWNGTGSDIYLTANFDHPNLSPN